MSHGLFSVMAGAAEVRPTLLAIDDLHWCEVASLEFVLYVLHRLDELPVSLVMTRRPGVGAESADTLDRISSHPRVQVESLMPLGIEAVEELTRDALGERAEPAVVKACIEVTNGNPFYVLAASGARPRRDALLSGPGSLTPSERRIAELAATGQSNREIAQALFVTPKTVEYHLRNAYRKLDIQTRGELAGALA
jgi:DNA-binding CsgD family transcriptional regulator